MAEATKEHLDELAADVDNLRKEIADVRVLGAELKASVREIRDATVTFRSAKEAARQAQGFSARLAECEDQAQHVARILDDLKSFDERIRDVERWRQDHESEVERSMANFAGLQRRVSALEEQPTRLEMMSDESLAAHLEAALDGVVDQGDDQGGDYDQCLRELTELRAEQRRRKEERDGGD